MAKRVTIKDIALALNTNNSTVSRALNDSPLISDQTKALVKKKALEMGYFPNSIARQLREGRSRIIGLVVPLINRAFFSNIIHGVESIARQKGYQLLICQSNDDAGEEVSALQTLRTQKVAGLIISQASNLVDEKIYKAIIADGTPIVMFDRVSTTLDVNKVVNANQEASSEAVRHLINQGYRRIVYFAGPQSLNIYQERFAGYRQALQEAGIPFDPALVFHDMLSRERGEEVMGTLLSTGLEFDAVASASDFAGLGALLTMRNAGISVPGEKGLIGFANESFTELVEMSSIEQFSIQMGEAAADLLFEDIEAKDSDEPLVHRQVVINPALVLRKSSVRLATGVQGAE